MKKSLTLLLVLLATTLTAMAQFEATPDWTMVHEQDEFTVEYRWMDCPDPANGMHKEYIVLRYDNRTSSDLIVKFDMERYYNGVCATCANEDNELGRMVELPANSVVAGDCTTRDRSQRVFYRMLKPKTNSLLTDLRLLDFTVSTGR